MALVCRDARLVRPLKKPLLAPKSPPPTPPEGGECGLSEVSKQHNLCHSMQESDVRDRQTHNMKGLGHP